VKQFISASLATRKTMQGQAQDLGGSWLAANDLNFSERYLAAVKRVTPEDLQRVAIRYLSPENRTTYALLPAGNNPVVAVGETGFCQAPVRKLDLPNGLRLLLKEDHRLPFVEFRAVFRGGVMAETAENSGITQMTGKLLLKGTTSRSAEDIALAIESVGGSIDTYGGNNSFGVNAEVLNGDFATGLDLVFDVIRNPRFPGESLEREREVQLATIRAQRDHLLQSAFKSMRRALFGACGYGLDVLGSEESVNALRQSDLQQFHQEFVRPTNCVLAIYGDIDPEAVERAVKTATADWQGSGPVGNFENGQVTELKSIERVSEKHDKKQAVLVIGFRGATLKSPDRYALDILQEACSDLGSRLFLRIREQLGLAYFVGAQNFIGVTPGFFALYAGTAPEQAAQVESELLQEAANLREEGLTQEELQRAKAKIIGQHKIARQDLGGVAMTHALDELYGLGYSYNDAEDARYEAVTLDQVRAAARKYLTAEALVVTVLSP